MQQWKRLVLDTVYGETLFWRRTY